jgi:hypothetical protein
VKLLCSAKIGRFNRATFHNRSIHQTVEILQKAKGLWVTNPKWGVTASPAYQAGLERIMRASASLMTDQQLKSVKVLVPNLISQKFPASTPRFPDAPFWFYGTIAISGWLSSKVLRCLWSFPEVFSNSTLTLTPSGRDPLCEFSVSDFLVCEIRSPSVSSVAAPFTATKARIFLQITEMKVRRHRYLRPNRDNNRH